MILWQAQVVVLYVSFGSAILLLKTQFLLIQFQERGAQLQFKEMLGLQLIIALSLMEGPLRRAALFIILHWLELRLQTAIFKIAVP